MLRHGSSDCPWEATAIVGEGHRDLDLLSAPTSVLSLAHVAWGFDRGNELQGKVSDTDDADDATSDLAEDLVAKKKAAEEDVD